MNTPRPNIRPAASVLVLREAPAGVQVLLMRRPERDNDFRSGACVFPGGVLDASDREAWRWCLGQDDAQASARLGLAEGGLDYFVAALRECFEEVGLLFVCQPDGGPVDLAPHAEALREWRHRLHQGRATMSALCAAFDVRLDLRDTAYFAHWLTPAVRPKRFDTRFFVRLAPTGQHAEPDMGEALELMWLTPADALDPARALKLLNVTQRTLHELRAFASAAGALAEATARRGVQRILPIAVRGSDGRERFVIPGQPGYDEVAHLDPEGRGALPAELRPGAVQQLSPRLWRVVGEQRNAYLVRDPDGAEWVAIGADAGDALQQQSLRATAGEAPRPLGPARDGESLRVGEHTTLRATAAGWLLEQERTLIGDAGALPGVEWLAPSSGFLQRCRSG